MNDMRKLMEAAAILEYGYADIDDRDGMNEIYDIAYSNLPAEEALEKIRAVLKSWSGSRYL